jgi:transcriptional regulator with XRE-family HTH domain
VEEEMAKKFSALLAKMPPHRQERAKAVAKEILEEMPLKELRKALQLTQNTIAETMQMSQGDVSKLERRADVYISTIRSYLHAMDAELEIVARFADGRAVKINQFQEVDGSQREHPRRRREDREPANA